MTYVPNTILTRKEPFADGEKGGEHDEIDLSVYNEVRVVGKSHVTSLGKASEWEGELGNEITVQPTSFGPTVDRPQGELQRDYEVTFVPETPNILPPKQHPVTVEDPGKTPEQKFAEAASASD